MSRMSERWREQQDRQEQGPQESICAAISAHVLAAPVKALEEA